MGFGGGILNPNFQILNKLRCPEFRGFYVTLCVSLSLDKGRGLLLFGGS